MPPVTTGAVLANKSLIAVGISGDGDTASIGMGHFIHLMRRNLPLIYIIENNGVYGLTKGQFSATADLGSKLKTGVVNDLPPIDTCALAIELGATFVARSFSGDKSQLQAILKAAISHRGLAMLDIISPCTTFNDHVGSTKSYGYMKDHEEPIHGVEFVPFFEDIAVEYDEGTETDVKMFDGSTLRLKKLARDWDPTDKYAAMTALHKSSGKEVLTGVLYVEENKPTFIDMLNLVDEPLWNLPLSVTRPGKEVLDTVMEELQ
jgi:2-oxoglutarate ferredoxin oxidoreductase subunit beta